MKTIGYVDLANQSKILYYYKNEKPNIFQEKRNSRIIEAIKQLKYTGNIAIYLIDNNKKRLLSIHRI